MDSSKDFSRLLISGSTPLLFRDLGFFCFLLERSSLTELESEVRGETELDEEDQTVLWPGLAALQLEPEVALVDFDQQNFEDAFGFCEKT